MFESILTFAQDSQSTGSGMVFDILQIASIVGMWKMFEKADQPGWIALVPFYNWYKLCEITMANPWYWLRLFVFFIPIVGWVAGLYFLFQVAKATALSFGKPDSWAWGYFFLSGVFYCITGFDDSQYYGPFGAGDNRTSQAKQSKTVNFEVVRDEPSQPQYQDHSQETKVEEIKPQEETVDFTFDQSGE